VSRIDGITAIVAKDEPPAARDLDRSEIIFVPISFVDFVNAVAAKAGRQQVSLAGQLIFPDIFFVEGDIDDIVVGGNGIGFFSVVDDDAAVFPIYLINVDQVKVSVGVCIVDI